MTFKIKKRFSGDVLFECQLLVNIANQPYSRQLGFAIKQVLNARADLACANLACAKNVPKTNSAESIKDPADRAERQRKRASRFRELNPDVPVIENLDATILEIVEGGIGKLNMGNWHTYEMTHCRAGWAVHIAGEAGKAL